MKFRALIVAFLAICLGVFSIHDSALAASQPGMTYDEILGTGLANNCPNLGETARGSYAIESGKNYQLSDLCLQPLTFLVEEESSNPRKAAEFVKTKVMTRYTTSLESIEGPLKPNTDGGLTFYEKDGIDFQAITVKMPGGELVPLLFTVKELVANTQPNLKSINTSTDFKGEYTVPSYRTSNFLDPKGRGLATGYDNAVARPGSAEKGENVKKFDIGKGKIALQVAKVDSQTGEIAGTFETEQPSDSDMGAHEPKTVLIQGIFYGRVSPQA